MRLASLLLFLAAAPSASAACGQGAPLVVLGWTAAAKGEATTQYSLEISSSLKKPARMVSGYVTFRDALGKDMGAFEIPRDDAVPANSKFALDIDVGSLVVPRILTINKADVVVEACVEGVVYEDGTKEEFK
ncbi:hypothetical protein ACIQUG_08185 [Ensifer sp. NPDC090286]|uniref:hypothetical protein n=1 Tax=Ensifer sp. NPDC090286 TaxID=3363991 RepID=UPI00383A6570